MHIRNRLMHTIPLTSACFFCLKATNLAAQFEKTLTACIISHPQLSLVPFQTDQATSIVGERSGFFSFHGIRSSSVLCPQQWQPECQGPTTGRTEIGNTVVPLPVFVSKTLFHIPLTSPSLPRLPWCSSCLGGFFGCRFVVAFSKF